MCDCAALNPDSDMEGEHWLCVLSISVCDEVGCVQLAIDCALFGEPSLGSFWEITTHLVAFASFFCNGQVSNFAAFADS